MCEIALHGHIHSITELNLTYPTQLFLLARGADFNGKSVRAENSDGCGVTGCGEGGEGACGLSVFVVWSGTDVNGKVLTSNDKRSSLFPEQSLNWDALQLK